jgi:hypothetical protein
MHFPLEIRNFFNTLSALERYLSIYSELYPRFQWLGIIQLAKILKNVQKITFFCKGFISAEDRRTLNYTKNTFNM